MQFRRIRRVNVNTDVGIDTDIKAERGQIVVILSISLSHRERDQSC